MLCSVCFQCYLKFHCLVTVGADKLVVIQFDDVALVFCNDGCNTYQFTRLVRDQDRNSKDSVSLDQTMLNNRRHGDHVHISTT